MLLKITDSEEFYKTIVDRLNRGGIVALPTDTVYGLAVDATNENAIEKLSRLKDRGSKPYTFFIPRHKLDQYAVVVKKKIIDYFLPGPLTVLLHPSGIMSLPRTGDRIGIRVPQHAFIARLLNDFSRPLAVTSANRSAEPVLTSAYEIVEHLTDVELVVDGGSLTGPVSTVLDLTTTPATLVRKGGVPILEIDKVQGRKTALAEGLQFNVLFVCTGNTCRSPMAMGLLRTLVDPGRVAVRSAGMNTVNGNPAAPNSIAIVRDHGGSIDDHRTQELTPELTRWADLILVMEFRHYEYVLQFAPDAVPKIFLLKEYKRNTRYNEIADPVGQDLEAYRRSALDMMPSLRFIARDIMGRFKNDKFQMKNDK
jgi:tRNA threonylcarbamoyl adenosine modification protein (Sua5/YciO/YrdC/YwlC family)